MKASKTPVSPLHVEWTPDHVRLINVATGQSVEASRLSDLESILSGHREALVGVGRSRVFLKAIRLPKAAPEDLRRMIGVQIGNLFPLPPDQLSFDFLQTADQTADGWLTIVAAVRAADIREIQAQLKQAGLTASRILPVSLAAAAVAAHAGAADALVAEHDAQGFSLDVVQGGVLRFSRVAPEGSDPAVEARRTLAAAQAGSLPQITVGAVALPAATAASDTALGLLHEAPPFHFELTEERARDEKKRIEARTRLAILMTVSALLLVLLVWVDRQSDLAVIKRGQGAWAREFIKYQAILDTETDKAQTLSGVSDALATAFQPAQPLSDINAVVASSLPPGAWLTGLTVERGKPLEARGAARSAGDVSRFVVALGDSPRFRDVKLVFANSAVIGKVSVIQFNVSAVCVGNLPLPAADAATGEAAMGGTAAPND